MSPSSSHHRNFFHELYEWPCTTFFRSCSRAEFCVHGQFFRKFTGKWMHSRALFGTFSRALFVVHGQKIRKMFTGTFRGSRAHFPQKYQKCRNLRVHGHFLQVHGHFFLKMFTGTFEVHGHFFGFTGTFLGSRARFFSKVHGQLQDVHGHFYEIVHGHFLNVHA